MSETTEPKRNRGIPRACGLLVIEVENSNPNGDPDRDSDPRQRPGGLGEISPVSFKRKLRDIVEAKAQEIWLNLKERLKQRAISIEDDNYDILEKRGRARKDIVKEIQDGTFDDKYWDGRLFGNTFLESKEKTEKEIGRKLKNEEWATLRRNIKSGPVQFGMGISLRPVEIRRHTETNKAGVGDTDKAGDEKQQGMAPLGCRYVVHGIYAMPFFVNPHSAHYSKCRPADLELMLQLIPATYPLTASKARPCVSVRFAHYLEHVDALGSFPDLRVLDALKQKAETVTWSVADAEKFLSEHAPKFARYRELVSGIEITPSELK
jgi:Cas7 group CRISPR-associated protein Csh2